MRVRFQLVSPGKILVPFRHSHLLQALVYNFLEKESSAWLHMKGFAYGKRGFKLFVYSDILERAVVDKDRKIFIFPETISFYLASPVDWILVQVAENIIKSERIFLGRNELFISSVSVMKQNDIHEEKITIKTLSPITVHSTFEKPDGKKITHYYTPFEKEFSELIKANLNKKWEALYKKVASNNFSIKPLFHTNKNEKIRYFKDTVIRGWTGLFEVNGDTDLLQFALDAGLGDRNSQGYGMVEVVKKGERDA